MNDIISYYVKGSQEGYFGVRLDTSILNQDNKARAFFVSGYQFGKSIMKKGFEKSQYENNRTMYITIMGFKTAAEGYSMNSSLLKGEDKKCFEDGYRVGTIYKEGSINQASPEDFGIYSAAMGFEAHDDGFNVYADLLDEELQASFHTGHSVNTLCNKLQDEAINKLNESQLKKCQTYKR